VALLKQPGDRIALDEPLCEVETDKAVYPVESSFAGVLKAWRCQTDDVIEIGRELVVVTVDATDAPTAPAIATSPVPPHHPGIQQLQQMPRASSAHPEVAPALSPAITRRLTGVIPVNMQLDALWKNLRVARELARSAHPEQTPSLPGASRGPWRCTPRSAAS